jgi:hypothetical protein
MFHPREIIGNCPKMSHPKNNNNVDEKCGCIVSITTGLVGLFICNISIFDIEEALLDKNGVDRLGVGIFDTYYLYTTR